MNRSTRSSSLLRRLGLSAALLVLFACFGAGAALADEPKEPPPAEGGESKPSSWSHLAGDWDSEWGRVVIKIDGNKVYGTWPDGQFEGTIDANGVINYSWTQPEGEGGKGTFNVNGDKLVGRWGFGVSSNNAGDWSLWRPKK